MKECHVCRAVCEDNAELCHVCGADLAAFDDEINNETAREIKNPVLVATVEDVVSAEIFKDILKDNGIIFSCSDEEDEGGMKVVFGGGFVSVDIYVDNSDFEAANALYTEFLESETEFDGEFFIEDEAEADIDETEE